jgi:hypothetical protein
LFTRIVSNARQYKLYAPGIGLIKGGSPELVNYGCVEQRGLRKA